MREIRQLSKGVRFDKDGGGLMRIQNKTFPDGELVIYTDYKRSAHAGAEGCFQIQDIFLENESDRSILQEINIDQGRHYHHIKEVLQDLLLPIDFKDYREEIV